MLTLKRNLGCNTHFVKPTIQSSKFVRSHWRCLHNLSNSIAARYATTWLCSVPGRFVACLAYVVPNNCTSAGGGLGAWAAIKEARKSPLVGGGRRPASATFRACAGIMDCIVLVLHDKKTQKNQFD